MYSKIILYLRLLRITSWAKNMFVFVPLIFVKHLFVINEFSRVLLGFIIFSLAASFVYIINDLYDAKKDVLHPIKKNRPIASGEVSTSLAITIAGVLFLAIVFLSTKVNLLFTAIIWSYVFLNILYSSYLKNIVIVDIFCISLGFMLRVIGGAVIITVLISNWLILTTLFLSLFLAVMKRRVEFATSEKATDQRTVLRDYSLSYIDQISSITAGGVIISYALYTVSDRTVMMFGSEYFVGTTIFVIFGIFRYMYLVYKKDKGEDVAETFMTDLPMIINSILYIIAIILFIYNKPNA